ncbi:MAG: RAMP superfamily CRISPR-associated protein [bacterium]
MREERRQRQVRLRDDEIYRDIQTVNQWTGQRIWEYYVVKELGNPIRKPLSFYHDAYKENTFTGRFYIWLKTLTPIFVGSGTVEITPSGNQQYFTFARLGGKIVIPGSSLKGDVRQYAEALSFSCYDGSCGGDDLCPACGIFGSREAHFLGRVAFEDAKLYKAPQKITRVITIPQRWGPRIEYGNGRKFYYHAPPDIISGRDKEWLEVVEKESYFIFLLSFENLEGWELGLLILAMGLAPDWEFPLKVGGGKNRGLGLVKLELIEGKSFLYPDPKQLCSSLSPQREVINQEMVRGWLNSYLEPLPTETKDKIKKIVEKFREGKPDGKRKANR